MPSFVIKNFGEKSIGKSVASVYSEPCVHAKVHILRDDTVGLPFPKIRAVMGKYEL